MIYGAIGTAAKLLLGFKKGLTADIWASTIHYRFAAPLLLICSILSGLNAWYSPIQCTPSNSEFDISYVHQFCYTKSPFIIAGRGKGIGNAAGQQVRYVHFYKWVTLALLVQAAFLYLPHVVWKLLEGHKIRRLVLHLAPSETSDSKEVEQKCKGLATYIMDRSHTTDSYYFGFVLYQLMYLFNVIAQVYILNIFLDNHFINYGWEALLSDEGEDIREFVFPKLSKCSVNSYGTSGDLQSKDFLCLLAMNVLYEKLYLLIWWVQLILLIISLYQFMFIVTFTFRPERKLNRTLFSRQTETKVQRLSVRRQLGLGDWLQLLFLQRELNTNAFHVLVEQICLIPGKNDLVNYESSRRSSQQSINSHTSV